jgi:hypothetical protein
VEGAGKLRHPVVVKNVAGSTNNDQVMTSEKTVLTKRLSDDITSSHFADENNLSREECSPP